MRGEKEPFLLFASESPGSPPHARGKVYLYELVRFLCGITPACAGKSQYFKHTCNTSQDHPRMRGEKRLGGAGNRRMNGSPPHARGKVIQKTGKCLVNGITPACAGKSKLPYYQESEIEDHPRMRGEKSLLRSVLRNSVGSPPHARGKD